MIRRLRVRRTHFRSDAHTPERDSGLPPYSNANGSPSANSPLTTSALTMMTLTKRSGRRYRELNSFPAKTCRRRDYDVPQRAA